MEAHRALLSGDRKRRVDPDRVGDGDRRGAAPRVSANVPARTVTALLFLREIAQAKGLQDRGRGLPGGNHLMTCTAILRNGLLAGSFVVGGRVAVVMAAEAAGIVHVSKIVGIGSPGNFEIRKYVASINCHQSLAR